MWKRKFENIIKFVPRLIRKLSINQYYKMRYWLSKDFAKFRKTINEKRIILIGTPEHKNLGDHAIAVAETNFFLDFFPSLRIVEISGDDYRHCKTSIIPYLTSEDIIVITGGGSMGTLWLSEEYMFRDIVKSFQGNKIIIFPQTIFYENSPSGRYELAVSKDIYRNHSNLFMCVRDRNSYDFVCNNQLVKNVENCLLVPDIVTYLNRTTPKMHRSGILICFRDDKEGQIINTTRDDIIRYASQTGENILYTDTIALKNVTKQQRVEQLENKFNEFRHAKIVITDRLHGMIFAAITGTPCIALNNISGKVEGVYKWINYLNYVYYAENLDDLPDLINELLKKDQCSYDNRALIPHFQKIANLIKRVS